MSYEPIQCQLYDYIEIACMHHYLLNVELDSGEIVEGTAINTNILNREEFLVIMLTNNTVQEIRLDKISQITALDQKASFRTVKIH